jgi:hypothetical protein
MVNVVSVKSIIDSASSATHSFIMVRNSSKDTEPLRSESHFQHLFNLCRGYQIVYLLDTPLQLVRQDFSGPIFIQMIEAPSCAFFWSVAAIGMEEGCELFKHDAIGPVHERWT